MTDYDVIIIGAGTAGLSALSEVRKVTDKVMVINSGPYGTTCARVGCMPSKVLIQIADDFHHRHYLQHEGILGGEQLTVDRKKALAHVRKLRDYFVSFVLASKEKNQHFYIDGSATFVDKKTVSVAGVNYTAKKFVIANGTMPLMPKPWQAFSDRILTTDNLFEQLDLPNEMAVIGGGVIGLEAGQALARIGIDINLFSSHDFIGGLSDPVVNAKAVEIMSSELNLHLQKEANISGINDGLQITAEQISVDVPLVLAAIGRRPNMAELQLQNAGVQLDARGMPSFDVNTMQIEDTNLFIAGDIDNDRPLLHEAADEGRIAGFNAARDAVQSFRRRCPIAIVFCQPNIARVGSAYRDLNPDEIAIGEVSYDDQGRARIKGKNRGCLRIYGSKTDGQLLGAEMIAPEGEHLAHILAWAMQQKMTVFQALQMPYYHPVIEEGMRTAMRDLARQLTHISLSAMELALCDSEAPKGLM